MAATAGREFSEETLGLFSSCSVDAEGVQLSAQHMTAQLRRRELVREVVQQLREVGHPLGRLHLWNGLPLRPSCLCAGHLLALHRAHALRGQLHLPAGHAGEPAERRRQGR